MNTSPPFGLAGGVQQTPVTSTNSLKNPGRFVGSIGRTTASTVRNRNGRLHNITLSNGGSRMGHLGQMPPPHLVVEPAILLIKIASY